MLKRPGRLLLAAGVALVILLIVARVAARIYTDYLWFASEGFVHVFWTVMGAELAVRSAAAAVAAVVVFANLWLGMRRMGPIHVRRRYGNLEIAEQIPRRYIVGGVMATAVLAGWWLGALSFGGGAALEVVAWIRRVAWNLGDPLFGRDVSFYVFALPVYYYLVDYLILVVVWSAALVLLAYVVVGGVRWRENRIEIDEDARIHFVVLLAVGVLLLAARYWLGRYGLLLDGTGFRGALGYTDENARIPAHRAMTTLSVLAAAALLYGAWRRSWLPPVVAVGALAIAAIGVGHVYPSMVQRFRVEPNELAREAPYIRWNIDFTRHAYGLENIERRQLPYRRATLPGWEALEPTVARLPLWDPEPLQTIFNQHQVFRAYYHFPRVDYNRYGAPGAAEQVALAVRELNVQGVAAEAQTWQTLRLNPLYVRGEGVVATPVAQSSGQGKPIMWVHNMPVEHDLTALPDLRLSDTEIYFGESLSGYVILVPERDSTFRAAPGVDSPAGIALNSFPRLLALAWRFADKNLIFSGDITDESRLVFRRSVIERVRAAAPFLQWDSEPYPVVHEGRVVWVLEGYTVSSNFPLSRAVPLERVGWVRYLRNSVKATVDAVSGAMAFYAVDGDDPILATYRRIFPDLVQPLDSMPEGLRRNLRYPAVYLSVQAELLKEYYLERPETFYAGQDYWQVPQERGPAGLPRPFRANYAMLRLPGEEHPEFLLTLPFTARERHNMTAMLVARNDEPHYGQLVLLELPRDQQISGPSQVDALIEQDPIISQQFGLWQRNNEIERGRLRIVPLDSTFLYVRPIFLLAHANPIPDLVGVVASDGVSVRMAATLAGAITALHAPENGRPDALAGSRDGQPFGDLPPLEDWPRRAIELLDAAESRLRDGDYTGFGNRLIELRDLLTRLNHETL